MFGWTPSAIHDSASRWKRARPSVVASTDGRGVFTATMRRSSRSKAMATTAIPPRATVCTS